MPPQVYTIINHQFTVIWKGKRMYSSKGELSGDLMHGQGDLNLLSHRGSVPSKTHSTRLGTKQ